MATSKPPKPGRSKKAIVTLPYELALELWAFQKANSGALQGQVLCDALAFFLIERRKENPQMELRLLEFRATQLKPQASVVQLINRQDVRRRKE
jgi:hypothetical protein